MKFVFFLTLLVNIVFFLWEYRKGAPSVYLPPAFEYSASDAQQILLLTKPPEITPQATGQAITDERPPAEQVNPAMTEAVVEMVELLAADKHKLPADTSQVRIAHDFIGPINQQPEIVPQPFKPLESAIKTETQQLVADAIQDSLESSPELRTEIDPISASNTLISCYHLNAGAAKKDFIRQTENGQNYNLTFTEQEVPYISNYLVLTFAGDTLQQARQREQTLKQQGINDLWMFKSGKFKWRISLGLFSSPKNAESAKELYARQTSEYLEVVPSWQNQLVMQVTINAQQQAIISDFERKFTHVISSQVDCLSATQ